jgi:hypothetical protein
MKVSGNLISVQAAELELMDGDKEKIFFEICNARKKGVLVPSP